MSPTLRLANAAAARGGRSCLQEAVTKRRLIPTRSNSTRGEIRSSVVDLKVIFGRQQFEGIGVGAMLSCSRSFSSNSDGDSNYVTGTGGIMLPRHQANTLSAAGKRVTEVSVNRSGLLPIRKSNSDEQFTSNKEGLARELEQMIHLNGPITVAEYMLYALQHPTLGYYMRPENKIGQRGDFVTAPEISQVFGEMIGVWCVATWTSMGSPSSFHLVELGPGKGTLMSDLLRAASSFPAFRKALTLHLVETSEDLKASQVKTLGAKFPADTVVEDSTTSSSSSSSLNNGSSSERGLEGEREISGELGRTLGGMTGGGFGGAGGVGSMNVPGMLLPGGGEAYWHRKLSQVPTGPSLFIAQEFLDALPVHQFQYTAEGWREVLIDINNNNEDDTDVDSEGGDEGAAKEEKAGGQGDLEKVGGRAGGEVEVADKKDADFRYVLSAGETVAVQTLLKPKEEVPAFMGGTGSLRTESSKRRKGTGPRGEEIGDRLEVCPESMLLVTEISKRIAEHGGGALLVDYGENHALQESLRCFKGHKEVPILSNPGLADMTADVDFSVLKRIVAGVKGARAHGPVQQGQFLGEMGIGERVRSLAEQPHVTEEQADAMIDGYVRLVDPDQMGARYKVLAITDERQQAPPPGFLSAGTPSSS